jgi:hypothetical protein
MLNRAWPQLGKPDDRSNMDFQGYVGSLGKRRQAGDLSRRLMLDSPSLLNEHPSDLCGIPKRWSRSQRSSSDSISCSAGYPEDEL